MYLCAEQQLLYGEFIEHCRPSSVLTLETFKQLMCDKGLNADSCLNTFRSRVFSTFCYKFSLMLLPRFYFDLFIFKDNILYLVFCMGCCEMGIIKLIKLLQFFFQIQETAKDNCGNFCMFQTLVFYAILFFSQEPIDRQAD